jgi:diguanylate cyclase (GGDEF)-like protein
MTDMKKMRSRFGLTGRETQVLRFALKGLKNIFIAENLSIAEQTVKEHLSRIYKKIGVKNKFELMHFFVKTSNERLSTLSKNIAELKRVEKELQGSLLTDELTGLYNRRGLLTLGEHQVRIAKRQHSGIYMLFADVDNLKAINDTLGHGAGDRALRETANILRETFRETDIVARVGGDEFVVLSLATSGSEADRTIARLEKNLARFNRERDNGSYLSVSYGSSCCSPESHSTIEELMFLADNAMCEQKKKKKESSSGDYPPERPHPPR